MVKNFGAGVSKQISFVKGGDGQEFRVTTRKLKKVDTESVDSKGSFLEKYKIDEDEDGNPKSRGLRQPTPKQTLKVDEALKTFSKFKDSVRAKQ